MTRLWPWLLAAAVLVAAPSTWACGACDEDKIAATYDHAVAKAAAAQRRSVVYCEIDGRVDPAALLRAARRVPGVDGATLRTSTQPPALSFALDGRRSARAAVAAFQQALPKGTRLRILKMESPRAVATVR